MNPNTDRALLVNYQCMETRGDEYRWYANPRNVGAKRRKRKKDRKHIRPVLAIGTEIHER